MPAHPLCSAHELETGPSETKESEGPFSRGTDPVAHCLQAELPQKQEGSPRKLPSLVEPVQASVLPGGHHSPLPSSLASPARHGAKLPAPAQPGEQPSARVHSREQFVGQGLSMLGLHTDLQGHKGWSPRLLSSLCLHLKPCSHEAGGRGSAPPPPSLETRSSRGRAVQGHD